MEPVGETDANQMELKHSFTEMLLSWVICLPNVLSYAIFFPSVDRVVSQCCLFPGVLSDLTSHIHGTDEWVFYKHEYGLVQMSSGGDTEREQILFFWSMTRFFLVATSNLQNVVLREQHANVQPDDLEATCCLWGQEIVSAWIKHGSLHMRRFDGWNTVTAKLETLKW